MVESVCTAWPSQKLSNIFLWLWCFQEYCLRLVATLLLGTILFLSHHSLEILLGTLYCQDPIVYLGWAQPFRENKQIWTDFSRVLFYTATALFVPIPQDPGTTYFQNISTNQLLKPCQPCLGPDLRKWPTFIGLPSYKKQLLTFTWVLLPALAENLCLNKQNLFLQPLARSVL